MEALGVSRGFSVPLEGCVVGCAVTFTATSEGGNCDLEVLDGLGVFECAVVGAGGAGGGSKRGGRDRSASDALMLLSDVARCDRVRRRSTY